MDFAKITEGMIARILARLEEKNEWTESEALFLALCHLANEVEHLKSAVDASENLFE